MAGKAKLREELGMKIGKAVAPDYKLTECISISERISSGYKGTISISGLASELQMAEGGGGFRKKLASLRLYALVQGRQQLQITPLAERILYPTSADESAASRAEAFLAVELFKTLSSRLGDKLPDPDRFRVILSEVTGATRSEVTRRAPTIRRLYLDGYQYLSAAPPIDDVQVQKRGGDSVTYTSKSSADFIAVSAPDMELRLPPTPESIDIIVSALNVLRRRLSENVRAPEG